MAEELHFGQAARRLRVAQPGLSQQIKTLERELGAELLERDRRQVRLTEAGELLLADAVPLLRAADDLAARVRDRADGRSGLLRIAYTRSAADLSPPKLVQAFRRAHPDVEIRAETAWTAHNLALIAADEIDVAFVRLPAGGDGIETLHLDDEELVVAVAEGHPLAARAELTPRDLAHEPIVLWPRTQGPGYFDSIVEQIWPGSAPNVVHEEPEAEQILAAVRAGAGAAVLDRHRAEKLRPPQVVIRRFAEPRPATRVGLAWRSADSSPVVRAFRDLCRELAPARHPSVAPPAAAVQDRFPIT